MVEESIESLDFSARKAVEEGRFAVAIRNYERVIIKADNDLLKSVAFRNCGVCFANLGEFDEARIYLDNAVRLNPEFVSAIYERGSVYRKQGNLESALADLERAVSLAPAFADAHSELGLCFTVKKDYESALGYFKAALNIFPDDFTFLGNVGKSYLLLGNPGEAINYFLKQINVEPLSALPHVSLSQGHRLMDNFMGAINSAERALSLDETCADAYVELGILMCVTKQFSRAVLDFWNALKISRDESIVEKLYLAVVESEHFNSFEGDCLLVQEGKMTVDALVSRLAPAITLYYG